MKADEILLSESNIERVWMDEDWNVRVEPTELGEWFFALRAGQPSSVQSPPRSTAPWIVAAVSGVVAVVAVVSHYL